MPSSLWAWRCRASCAALWPRTSSSSSAATSARPRTRGSRTRCTPRFRRRPSRASYEPSPRAHIAARVKATARRFLQLVAEQRVLAHFSQSPQLPESATDAATARALAEVLGCSAIDADARALFLTQLFNRVPLLLCLSRTQTLSDRLVRAAAADLSCPASLVAPANETLLLRVCLRILRGRAPHQRVTKAAATELAALLRRCSALPASPEAEGAAEPEPLEEEAKGPAGPEAFEGKAL